MKSILTIGRRLTQLERWVRELQKKLSSTSSSSSAGEVVATATTPTSKYLLTKSGNTLAFDGVKLEKAQGTPETLLWKKDSNQLTVASGVSKNGAMTTATITANDGIHDRVVVGAGLDTSYWRTNKQFGSRRFVVRMKVRVDALGTTPVLGIRSVWPGATYNSFNNTIYWGYANLLTGVTTFSAQSNSDVKTTNNSFNGATVVGDILTVEYVCNYMEERIFRVIKNDSVVAEVTSRRDVKNHAGDTLLQNHHHIGFIMGDGTYTILDTTIHTKEPQYPKIMFCGDSMATSVRVLPENTLWGYMRDKIPYPVSMVAGTSAKQKGVMAMTEEILKIKPEYIVLFVWIDPIYLDYANPASGSYATWGADFNKFVNILKDNGIKVILPYPQNWAVLDADGGSSTFYADYINTNFPDELKLYIPTAQAFYDSTGFHYNATTNNWVTDQIISILETENAL